MNIKLSILSAAFICSPLIPPCDVLKGKLKQGMHHSHDEDELKPQMSGTPDNITDVLTQSLEALINYIFSGKLVINPHFLLLRSHFQQPAPHQRYGSRAERGPRTAPAALHTRQKDSGTPTAHLLQAGDVTRDVLHGDRILHGESVALTFYTSSVYNYSGISCEPCNDSGFAALRLVLHTMSTGNLSCSKRLTRSVPTVRQGKDMRAHAFLGLLSEDII